ncbi:hypothetical protein EMCRGX_G003065 [Ephydatia muelleri]
MCCQRMNRKLTTGVPQLYPISVYAPWYMIGIDFIGPVSPEAEDGSKYILTVSDYFTKWVEAIPTIDNKAVTVATVLFKIFTWMGLPRVVVSDNGSDADHSSNPTHTSEDDGSLSNDGSISADYRSIADDHFPLNGGLGLQLQMGDDVADKADNSADEMGDDAAQTPRSVADKADIVQMDQL